MNHGLFVAALEVPKASLVGSGILLALDLSLHQRLPESGDVAVSEDAEAARNQPPLNSVALGVLPDEEPHQRLSDSQPDPLAHPRPPKGSRESTFWEVHVRRTQACSGSSVTSHSRRGAGPAITFR